MRTSLPSHVSKILGSRRSAGGADGVDDGAMMLRLVSPSGGRADVSGRDSRVSRVSRGSSAVLEATRARRRDLRAVARAAFSDPR